MKYYLITIITLLFMTVSSVNAQNINIGTKIGLNSYTVDSGNNSGVDSRIGIHAGLLGHVHITRQFAFQPELTYSMQGAKVGNTEIKLDYINVPLQVQYMFDNGFRLQAGPQLGVLVNAKSANNSASVDIKDNYKSFDAAISFGVGYIHPPTDFGIDLRYNLGVNDITENSVSKATNRGFQLGIFYLFNHN